MYKIATLNKISPVGLGTLGDNYSIIENADEASGIILRSADMHEMKFSTNLLGIARAGAGFNNIPIDRCAKEGIVVFNTPGANANAVKELVLNGLFLSSRNVPAALDWAKTLTTDVKKAVEKGKSQFAGTELMGKTLGVIGLGAIGVLVANAAQTLGMKVIGYDPFISIKSAHALSTTIPVTNDLAVMLPQCDFVTIHVPVMDETKGMMDSRRFAQMKPGAVFLNFARDTLVNDNAVLEVLESGHLKNYVTDFPNDAVLGKKGVIATPHLGASTAEAEDNCATMAATQLMDYIERGNIINSVNYPQCSMGAFNPESDGRICILSETSSTLLEKITGILSELNVTINDMTNKTRGNFAYTMMDVQGDLLEDNIVSALSVDGIIKTRVIQKK